MPWGEKFRNVIDGSALAADGGSTFCKNRAARASRRTGVGQRTEEERSCPGATWREPIVGGVVVGYARKDGWVADEMLAPPARGTGSIVATATTPSISCAQPPTMGRYGPGRVSRCLWRSAIIALLLCVAWTVVMLIPKVAGASELTSFAYVTNLLQGTVSVINTATDTVVATVPVGSEPNGVAITPNGEFAYVANSTGNDVSVINTYTDTVVATVPVASGAWDVAISPNGAFAYVTNYSSTGGVVSVINTSTNTVVATVPLTSPVGSYTSPIGVAITPDGAYAYVTDNANDYVSVIDAATNAVVATVPLGDPLANLWGVAITPDGAFAYAADGDSVSVINTSTNTVVATVADPSSRYVAITPDGAFAYVTNQGSNNVAVISTSTNTVVATVPVGTSPFGVAITPDGALVYVTNYDDDSVSVINTSTNTVVATVGVGSGPSEVALTPARATSATPPPANITPPAITGKPKAGTKLTCSTGSWTNDPTSYAYHWYRNGTLLAGFTTSTHTLGTLDEGTTLKCVVTANNAGGQASAQSNAVKIRIPKVPQCPGATGSMTGTTIGQIALGMTRARARYVYRHHSNRGKQYQDFFCLTPIGVRVGYASPILLDSLPKHERATYQDRVLWASTSNPYYSLDGIRPGESIQTASQVLGTEPPFHIGLNYWYLARKASYTAVLKVRGTVVQELGIADNALTKTRKAENVLMHSFY